MPFNINSPLQPECGEANPLIAASMRILGAPPAVTASIPMDNIANFAEEFIQQQHQPQAAQNHSQQSQISHHPDYSQQLLQQRLLPLRMQATSSSSQIPTAGEQLEAKYRSEVLESQDDTKLDVDKMSVWQILSLLCTGTIDNADRIKSISRERHSPRKKREIEAPWFKEMYANICDSTDDLMQSGLRLFDQCRFYAARVLFERLTTLEPGDAIAWRYLGIVIEKTFPDDDARVCYEKCLELNYDGEAKLRLSQLLADITRTKNVERYKHLFEWLAVHERYKSLGLDADEYNSIPDEIEKYEEWTISSRSEGKFGYLRDKYIEAARLSPKNLDPDVQRALGILFLSVFDFQKASDCWKAALSVKQNDADLWLELARSLDYSGNLEASLIASKRAFLLEPLNLKKRALIVDCLKDIEFNYETLKQLVIPERDGLIWAKDDTDVTEIMLEVAAHLSEFLPTDTSDPSTDCDRMVGLNETRERFNSHLKAAAKEYLDSKNQ